MMTMSFLQTNETELNFIKNFLHSYFVIMATHQKKRRQIKSKKENFFCFLPSSLESSHKVSEWRKFQNCLVGEPEAEANAKMNAARHAHLSMTGFDTYLRMLLPPSAYANSIKRFRCDFYQFEPFKLKKIMKQNKTWKMMCRNGKSMNKIDSLKMWRNQSLS